VDRKSRLLEIVVLRGLLVLEFLLNIAHFIPYFYFLFYLLIFILNDILILVNYFLFNLFRRRFILHRVAFLQLLLFN